MIKYFIAICLVFVTTTAFSQTYSPGAFPSGTSTIEALRDRYTNQQLKTMLEGTQISRNALDRTKLGFVFTDPNNSSQILVCDNDTFVILYEYIKLLRQEITTLKSRLQSAGIP